MSNSISKSDVIIISINYYFCYILPTDVDFTKTVGH